MSAKKIVTFFSLFFLITFSINYISARIENRSDYRFVITKVKEHATGHVSVSNTDNKFRFINFESYKIHIKKGDSLVKKAFSKNVYIYRKNKNVNKYSLVLKLNESAFYPIDWQ